MMLQKSVATFVMSFVLERRNPLHINLLGAGNDVRECLEKHFPNDMDNFYKSLHLKKSGQAAGGKFHGPSIKCISVRIHC